MAPFIGGALAVSGAQMQTTLNNQLADPYTFTSLNVYFYKWEFDSDIIIYRKS